MAFSQGRDNRKPTGGRKKALRGKRRSELGNQPIGTLIAKEKKEMKVQTVKGGAKKVCLTYALEANVLDRKTKKYTKACIMTERENPANRNFARRNVLTKGAIIETSAGFVRITSRPSQDGVVNAELLPDYKPKK